MKCHLKERKIELKTCQFRSMAAFIPEARPKFPKQGKVIVPRTQAVPKHGEIGQLGRVFFYS